MYDFYKENKTCCISTFVVMFVCLVGAWLVLDYYRNEPVYDNTDNVLADVNQGITNAEGRIDAAAGSVAKAEAAVGSAAAGIANSAKAAGDIAAGIAEFQNIIDRCIQRAGRIENIIADIEAINRKRTPDTSASGMAK